MVVLALNLPPHGFYAGDSGVKMIAAFNAIAHPAHPFDIDLPRIAGARTTFVERFFEVHDDHAHALQSPVFPLLTAPFVALFGVRGAYVLPAVSFIALIPLLFRIQQVTAPHVRLWLMAIIAVAANPVLFYGLELWEHAPAIALVAAATAVAWSRPVAAGLFAGLAILLRPEALWYAVGLLATTGHAKRKAYAIAVAASLAPFAIYNFAHSGNVLGPHAGANLAPLAKDWALARAQRIALWLIPSAPVALGGFAIIATAHAARVAGLTARKSQVMALCGAVIVAWAAIGGALNRESLWRVWPLALLLLLMPGPVVRNRLWIPAIVSFTAVLLLSTHDGGAQWGPRFLLIAAPALIVLAADTAQRVIERQGSGSRRGRRSSCFCSSAPRMRTAMRTASFAARSSFTRALLMKPSGPCPPADM